MFSAEQINNIKQGRDTITNFYDTTEDTPMKLRILMFRQQFKELSTLQKDQVVKLI